MSLRQMFRRIFFHSLAAGSYDAIQLLQGKDSTALTVDEAVSELFKLMVSGNPAGDVTVIQTANPPAAPQLPAATQDADGPMSSEPPSRPRGRPRKYQEPPT